LVSTKVSSEGDEREQGVTYEEVPLVRFQNGLTIPIYYHEWMSEDVKGIGIRQIPLILAWAVSIHKCQGMTMTIAEIDIGSSVFEFAQSYVALSRVQTLGGLYLKSFDSRKIRADPRAVDFYRSLKEKRLAWKAGLVVRDLVKGVDLEVDEEVCREVDEEDTSTVVENYMKPSVPIDPDVKVIDFSRYDYRG
jgi:hypothetical protein